MWLNLTRGEAERRFNEWVASEPERRAQLTAWVAGSGGPVLEPTLDSLRPLNRWYLDRAVEAQRTRLRACPRGRGGQTPTSSPRPVDRNRRPMR